MRQRSRYFPFGGRGLQTTTYGRSGRPDDFFVFQDVEVDHGDTEGRGGSVLVGRVENATGILNFDGTNDRVDFPTELALGSILGLKWTIEVLFKTTSIPSNRTVIGKFDATAVGLIISHTSSSTVQLAIRDSGGATTTITHSGVAAGTLCGLQITRDGAALTSYLNGDVQTGTMSATNLLDTGRISAGTSNGAVWFLGAIDYFRGWSVVRTTQKDLYMRRMYPRHKDCLFDFVLEDSTAHDVIDRGRNQYHAATQGTPTWDATALAVNAKPIQALGYVSRKNGARELVAVAGGTVYGSTVT